MQAQESNARHLTDAERRLVQRLLEKGPTSAGLSTKLDEVRVVPMNDGGMGSLRFVYSGKNEQTRKMGRCLSQFEFNDADGVRVIASLDVDEQGNLFELDIWKVDFSPLLHLPE